MLYENDLINALHIKSLNLLFDINSLLRTDKWAIWLLNSINQHISNKYSSYRTFVYQGMITMKYEKFYINF